MNVRSVVASNQWSIPLEKLTEQMQTHVETVARKVTLDVFRKVLLRSPVGNPELWAANATIVANREAYRVEAMTFNAQNPDKRRKGTGRRTVEKKFPLISGKGYVGGRFRANWNVSYQNADVTTTESTDKARGEQEVSKALTLPIGGIVWMSNGLPYAQRLEDGHSKKQAPAGMLKVTVAEFGDIAAAVRK